jgi:TetR/AcrR family transcriptional regulator
VTRDAEKSREAILRAAEELFAKSGPEQVSLGDVATQAGVSRGLPSYFFKDKNTLSRTVMERAAEEVRAAVLDPIRSSRHHEPGPLVASMIDDYIDYLAAHPRVVRLLQWNALARTAEPRPDPSTNVVGAVLREAVTVMSAQLGTTTISKVPIQELIPSVVALCLYPFERMHANSIDKAFVQRHKRHVKTILGRVIGREHWRQ